MLSVTTEKTEIPVWNMDGYKDITS